MNNCTEMRILWSVNTLMPSVAKELGISSGHAISWVEAMSQILKLNESVRLAIACVGKVDELYKKEVDGVLYYVIPRDYAKKDYWSSIIRDFIPDIIHAYGTENTHNLRLLRDHHSIPILISLQGLVSEYIHHYYAGIEHRVMLRYLNLKGVFLPPTGFFSGKRAFEKQAQCEQEQLMLCKYVEGRSTWDRVSALNINPSLEYFYCPRAIRSSFFHYEWAWERVIPHSIFVSQGNYPIKGIHFVLKAVSKLKRLYPDVKLYIAGTDIFHPRGIKQRLLSPSYVKYLLKIIKDNDLENCIVLTGRLDADAMARLLSTMNVAVVSSSIENAPNSLAESMIVGTPSIASFVGGNMDMLKHGEEGFLYCYNEPNMLAEYVSRFFESKDLSTRFSNNAKETARARHDTKYLEKQLLSIYSEIINSFVLKAE